MRGDFHCHYLRNLLHVALTIGAVNLLGALLVVPAVHKQLQAGLGPAQRLDVVKEVALLLLVPKELVGATAAPLYSVPEVYEDEEQWQDAPQRFELASDQNDHPANGESQHEDLHQCGL